MKTRPTGNTSNADWMGALCPALTSMPLKHLAVPGESLFFLVLLLGVQLINFVELIIMFSLSVYRRPGPTVGPQWPFLWIKASIQL